MIPRKLANDYYLLCGIDRRLEKFENIHTLPYGVSYNSYFLDDEKTVVLDSIDHSVADDFMLALEELLAGRELDILVCNHAEPDHTATLQRVMFKYPKCQLYMSSMAYKFNKQFFPRLADYADRVVEVNEGEGFSSGQHEFVFYKAPNVHWPEVTFCFDKTTGTLFSADAFGSFGAPSGHVYSDQVDYGSDWLAENRRYYCNIVGRQGQAVLNVLAKLEDLEIKQVYPLHGLLFRQPEDINLMLGKYRKWANYEAEEQGTVIVYGSLYDHSAKLADALAGYLADEGCPHIRVYDVSKTNSSFIIAELFRFSHAVFICNNYNTELYPPMNDLLRELMLLKWDNHQYSILGNKSWGGRGVKIAEDILSQAKNLERLGGEFGITSSLKAEEREDLQAFAREIMQYSVD